MYILIYILTQRHTPHTNIHASLFNFKNDHPFLFLTVARFKCGTYKLKLVICNKSKYYIKKSIKNNIVYFLKIILKVI